MNNRIDKHIIRFFILILLQVYILNNILFLNIINPYVYIYFILLLPFNIPASILTLLGFLIGFTIDIFTDTLAIHAAASTFIAFLRPAILKLFMPLDGYEINSQPTIKDYSIEWWLKYSIVITGIHHFTLFLLDKFNLYHIGFIFLKTFLSTLLSVFLMTLFQFYFYKSSSKT